MKKKEVTQEAGTSSELFKERDELLGLTGKINPEELDARLLYWVVVTLANRSASIQLGVTKDSSAWAVQYWDGKVPIKEYFNDTQSLNRSFAGLLRAAYRRDVSTEMDDVIRMYGW